MRERFVRLAVAILAAAGMVFAATTSQQGSGNQTSTQSGVMRGRTGRTQGRMGLEYGRGWGYRMMADRLASPVGRSMVTVFLLPEMQSELGLSSSQTAKLSGLKQQFTNQEQKDLSQIAAARRDLHNQFRAEKLNQELVKKDVSEIANLQAQRLLNGYEMAAKMKDTLTPQQQSRLKAMNTNGLYKCMMSHMTLDQVAQMMRYMYGGARAGMMYGARMGMMSGMYNGNMPYGMMRGQGTRQQP